MLREMIPKQHAALRRAQVDATAHLAKTNNGAMGSGRSLLSLPPEIRHVIYNHFFSERDVLVVLVSKPYTGPLNPDVTVLRKFVSS